MRVATHDGSLHADEVFAVAALSLLGEPVEIVRSRDEAVLAACDARVDVGFRSDPATGDFDHHQREGAGERPNGIRYASFGLVWRHHGTRICGGDADVAERVDQSLVQGVDANDTGQEIMAPLLDGVRPMTVSGVIGTFNPTWEEELTRAEEDRRFEEAVALAAGILEREIASAHAGQRARRLVEEAIARAVDPRVVVLEHNIPWKEVVVTQAPDALFVVYPKRHGWGLEAVPRELGSFDNRRDLPQAWAGLDGPELARLTGVDGALFCHARRFLAVARSRAAIDALAAQALDGAG
ncbi:MAG TPA: MYG1 family protein [Solirubrobacteraceae bacterium]|nr:MYG1 family protein [Solirubrobacteraceae bacterium]